MVKTYVVLSMLIAGNIGNVLSYTTYGFYQGPNKVNSGAYQQVSLQQVSLQQPTPVIYGLYQRNNKEEPEDKPTSLKTKYVTNGFYQGPQKRKPVPELANGPYEDFDKNNVSKKKTEYSIYLQDDEKDMLKKIERVLDDDVTIKMLLKLIKKLTSLDK